MCLADMLQASHWSPLQNKAVRVSEDTNESDYVWVAKRTELVKLIAHVTVVLCEFCGTVGKCTVTLLKDFHSNFYLSPVALNEIKMQCCNLLSDLEV